MMWDNDKQARFNALRATERRGTLTDAERTELAALTQELADNPTESTTERQEIDPVFKDALTKHLGGLNLTVQTEVEVSRLPRTMDALVVLKSLNAIERVRAETAFTHFREHNEIEFKGEGDALTLWKYRLILGRSNLYMGEQKVRASEMTVTIVSARRPTQVLENCPDEVRWEQIAPGYYKSTDLLPIHLFVCDELEINPKNYLLLLFAASEEKLRQFFERIVEEEDSFYLRYAVWLKPTLMKEVLEMAGKLNLYQQDLKRFAEAAGEDLIPLLKEKIIEQMTPEERLRGLQPEERLRGLQPEERLRGLQVEEVIRGLDENQLEQLKQFLNGQGKQT